MTLLYPNLCSKEVCCKGTALYIVTNPKVGFSCYVASYEASKSIMFKCFFPVERLESDMCRLGDWFIFLV